MGCGPEAVVVLHVGGSAGGRDAALERCERGLELVGEAGRRRLVIENDDRSFGLGDVLELHRRTGLRVVWDAHHHLRMAKEVQLHMWTSVLERVPKLTGGRMRDGVDIHTVIAR
jgi:UV DNA damage endonuclease